MKVIKIHVYLGIFLALISYKAYAQGVSPISFSSSTISSAENGATDVFAIDLDEDGDVDILSSSYLDDTIAWYENDGSGGFTQHNINTSVNGASSVYAIDVDGDDDIDVVSVAYSDDAVYWFENNGSESFTRHTLTVSIDGPRHAFPADIDEDDDIDIIVASSNDGKITFYENNGSESFTENTLESSISGVTSVFVINLDRKKGRDIVYAADVADEIGWLENDDTENFTKTIIASSLDGANSVFVEDVDSDGHRDIVVSISVDDEIAWFKNDGSASFIKNSLTTSADGATDVFAGDLDYDGDIDILSSSNGDDTIAWFENNGTESFTEHNISTEANGARAVFAADIGDGFGLDVLTASFFDDKILYFKHPKATPKFSNLEVTKISLSENMRQLIVSDDITGDGKQDIILSKLGSQNDTTKVYLIEQLQDSEFKIENEIASFEGAIGSDFGVFDLDQDGDKDIVGRNSDLIFWLKNNGGGNFSQHTIASLSGTRYGIDVVDFNSDGDLDIIIGGPTEVVLLDNNSSEIFTSSILVTEPILYYQVIDFDFDGDYDIAGTSYASVLWLENTGGNTFIEHNIYLPGIGSSTRESIIKDFDQDGDYDIAMFTSNDVARVHVFINDGSMNFLRLTIASNLDYLEDIDAGDFDLDGTMDILITATRDNDINSNTIYLFLNQDGVFKRHDIATTGRNNNGHFKDIDGDGLIDIVLSANEANAISWIKNPLHKLSFPNYSSADISSSDGYNISSSDVDQDGDFDIIVASYNDNEVNLLLNDGNASFIEQSIVTTSGADHAKPIDFDQDGDIDVVVSSFIGDKVFWLENDGSENFTENVIVTVTDGASDIEIVDLDRDGDLDIIVALSLDDKIIWLKNNNFASFTVTTVSSAVDYPTSISVADMDEDGDLDLVSSSYNDDKIAWYQNNGSQVFTQFVVSTSENGAFDSTPIDVDLDGDIDIVTSARNGHEISWYENDGSESFTKKSIGSSINGAFNIVVRDIDLDGDLDVAYTARLDKELGWFENNGSQNFKKHLLDDSFTQVSGLVVEDFNADGVLDFVAGSSTSIVSDRKLRFYENHTYRDQVTLGGTVGAQWRLFSLPKSGAKLSDVSNFLNLQGITDGSNSSSDANIFTYDNSGAWEEPSSVNDAMVDGYGFAVYTFDSISDSLDIRGSEPAADVSVSLNKSTLESGSYYTLVGNPYYSNYDLNSLTINSGNLQDNVSFWDANGQTYQVKDRTSNYIISPYQGFWVGVTNGNSATTLTFPKSGQTDSDTSGTWLRKQNDFKGDLEFSLKTESGYRDDAIRLAVRDYATQDWDRADAGKLKSLSSTYVSLAFEGNLGNETILKSVESLPKALENTVIIPMDLISVDVEGSATLSWKFIESLPENWELVFQDSKAGQSINMREYSEYNFELSGFLEKDTSTSLKVNHSSFPRFNIIITQGQSVSNELEELPSEFSLSQNYPNPFNPSTTIKYTLSRAGKVTISVFNLLGQRIVTLVDEQKPAGNYEIRFDASSLTSGVYFYKMESATFTSIKKMTLIK